MKKFYLHYAVKIFVTAVLSVSVLFLSACGAQVLNSTADEIRANSWEYNGEQGLYSKLEFDENLAVLTISNNDEYCEIKGLSVIDDDNLIIIDNSLKKEFLFNYEITGTTLTLERSGTVIEFLKITN